MGAKEQMQDIDYDAQGVVIVKSNARSLNDMPSCWSLRQLMIMMKE
jgi:hypothetical protein